MTLDVQSASQSPNLFDDLDDVADDTLNKPVADVSNMDFANEVRFDRVNILWKVTLAISVLFLWIAFMRRTTNGDLIGLSSGALVVGSLLCAQLIRRNMLTASVWVFVLSGVVAAVFPMTTGNQDAINIAPFVFPMVVILIGLLLPPLHTLLMLGLTMTLTIVVPFTVTQSWAFFGVYQIFALLLSILSALLAVQVTGELYQITGWALENYSRVRRTSIDLFENRQRLEKALRRSQVLGEKLQTINEELESAKHFRGQFLANMSHELRTPLNAIIGFSETMLSFPMMYDDIELPEAYRRDLSQIHTSGQQLLTVINDILDLSKVDAGKLEINLEPLSLDPIVDNVMMTTAGLISKKPIELKREVPLDIPDIYADESRIRQVLLNLYSNAAKFTDEGSITIRAKEVPEGLQISITDTGSGIPEQDLEKIFEEFTQTEAQGRDPRAGAGLGLTISRRLMGLMNGRIWAESVHGQGSTFHVLVPKYDPAVHGGSPKRKHTGRLA